MDAWAISSAVACALLVGLAFYVARHGTSRRLAAPVILTLVGGALLAFSDFLGSLAGDARLESLGLVGIHAGLALLVPSWWVTVLRFAEVHGLRLRFASHPLAKRGPALAALLFFLAIVSNPWHGHFLQPTPEFGRSDYGEIWVAFALYGYGLLLASFVLLLRMACCLPSRSARLHATLLAAGVAIPTAANLAYVLSPVALPVDPTPTGLALAALLFVAGMQRRQLLSLNPELLAQVLRQDTEPVFLLDGEGALVHANGAGFAWLGCGEDERPADVPERLAARLRASTREEPVDPERLRQGLLAPARVLHALFRSDEGRWLRLSSRALPGTRGRAALVVARLRDETPLHRVSEALAEQAATLDAVLASSGDGILVVDRPQGRVRYVNQAFVEIVGMEPRPRVGEDAERVRQAVHPLIRRPDRLDAAIAEGLDDPRRTVALSLTTQTGRTIEGSARGVLREGKVVARLFQVRDVTERRRSEDAVRLSQKLESLSVMAGGIAHDFNNLLVAVLGNAELARDTLPDDAEAQVPLREVETAAERATELTRQLLAYAGRSRVEPEAVDISGVARDVLSQLGASIPSALRVETRLAADPPGVVGDPGQLRQVAMSLVRNAVEAAASQAGCVRIESGVAHVAPELHVTGIDAEVSPSRPLVFLRVCDDGPGMDEAVRQRIFDPFFSTKGAGRGLGLAASLGIVRSHGGALQVESAPGEGSIFTVLLPSTGEPVAPTRPTPPVPPSERRGAGRVLVVDDEPGVLRVASRILEAAGFEVTLARDGLEALERYDAEADRYRAVLVDLTMPRLSGEETLRELRRRDPRLPVLLSSGYPRVRQPDWGSPSSTAFVAKPYASRDLLAALHGLLDRHAADTVKPPGDVEEAAGAARDAAPGDASVGSREGD